MVDLMYTRRNLRTFGVLAFFLSAHKTPGAQQLRDLYLMPILCIPTYKVYARRVNRARCVRIFLR